MFFLVLISIRIKIKKKFEVIVIKYLAKNLEGARLSIVAIEHFIEKKKIKDVALVIDNGVK